MNPLLTTITIIAGTGALCLLYGFFIEPLWIRKRCIDITLPPTETTQKKDSLRVAFFSDIHFGRSTTKRKLEKQMHVLREEEPDAILFGGDLVEEGTFLGDKRFQKTVIDALASLHAPLGKWAVFGNHDVEAPRFRRWVEKVLPEAGFTLLENEGTFLAGLPLWGFSDDLHTNPAMDKTFAMQQDSETRPFTIYLIHESDAAPRYIGKEKPGLVLSGHAHGGQVTLFGIPLIRVPGAKQYWKGAYSISEKLKLYDSTGLGTVHIHARFFARPEIVFITIKKGPDAKNISFSFR